MSAYHLSQLSDSLLVEQLTALAAADRHTTAALLAHLAEVEARKLYLPAACSSMHNYCVRVLRLGVALILITRPRPPGRPFAVAAA